ncbi:MAG: glycosyltransferase family 39 protein, partial [Tepidisphaeraceae bacterium]
MVKSNPSAPPPPIVSPPITNSRHWLGLTLILAVAAFLRFYDLAGPSLWMDEIWSIEISTGRGSAHDLLPSGSIQTQQYDLTTLTAAPPWWKIWTTMQRIIHPPLYHIALRWWMDAFSNAPGPARALSAVFSLAAIAVFFDVTRLLHGPRTALWAAALMTLSVAQIEFAQEARSYPMLILLGLISCDLLIRIEQSGVNACRLTALAIALAAAQLTHYFAAPAIAALFLYALLRLRGRDRLRTLAAFAAAIGFFAVVWGRQLIGQLHDLPTLAPEFLKNYSQSPLQKSLGLLLSLPAKFFTGDIFFIQHPQTALIVATIAAAMIIPLPIFYAITRRKDMLIWILWLFAIVGFLACMDIFRRANFLQYLRYSILASPAVFAMVAAFSFPARRRQIRPVALIALTASAYLAATRAIVGVPPKGDWRQLADLVQSYVPQNEVLAIYYHDPFVTPGMWYMAMHYYQPESNRPWLLLRQPADAQ